MGHGASVIGMSPATVSAVYRAASTQTQRWRTIVDERVLARVHRAVETHVLVHVRRAADELEIASKLWFVQSISTTTIADAFAIALEECVFYVSVCRIAITKRVYEVYNCGPELRDVPTLATAAAPSRVLELCAPSILAFLLRECLWTTWRPPTSWRMKTDQVYDVAVHVRTRRDGFLTGDADRVVRLRVGRKWVGPHHHTTHSSSDHTSRTQWLHRVDYDTTEHAHSAASAFFETIQLAYTDFVTELARLPVDADGLRAAADDASAFAVDAQDRRTHLRVKYLLETSLAYIESDSSTLFRTAQAFESWRMALEDAPQHREHREDHFAGPLFDAPIDTLAELYEQQTMVTEDVNLRDLPRRDSSSASSADEDAADDRQDASLATTPTATEGADGNDRVARIAKK